jgi:MFS transporter, NNP family, nitrate/nitrite transporter
MELTSSSGTLIGRIDAGTPTWIQNAGFIWLVFLVPLAFLGWFGMNNLRTITPNPGTPARLRQDPRPLWRGVIATVVGIVTLQWLGMWVALPVTIMLTLG